MMLLAVLESLSHRRGGTVSHREDGTVSSRGAELYLVVAIHKVPEKEQEALSLFSSAFEHLDSDDGPALGPRSELWARAGWARLVRRLDSVTEAEAQERPILYVVVILQFSFDPFTHYETDSGFLNSILEHPDEPAAIKQAREPQIVSATAVLPTVCLRAHIS